nr:DUF4381 domain-containing protein [uncultured Rhodoferax sp.]
MGGMSPDWLAQLAPNHAPAPPGWWPLAPGWWGLVLLTLLLLAGLGYWQTRRPQRLRRAALKELTQLEKTPLSDAQWAAALEHLVRRYAVARYGREAVAGLSGQRWINFVVTHGGVDWQGEAGAALLQAAYGGPVQPKRARWVAGARAFFKSKA